MLMRTPKRRLKTFYEQLTEAVNYYVNNGWDSQESLISWSEKLRKAANRQTHNAERTKKYLTNIYSRLVVDGGVLKFQPSDGPSAITLKKIKPDLRAELDRRIFASTNLIKLNRTQAVDRTIQRFEGWVSSVPPSGSAITKRAEQKKSIMNGIDSYDFIERRVAIDQGHKLASNVSYLLAIQGGVIAFKWHSNWRRPGYQYRKDHKERDDMIYLVRDSWAIEKGLIKPVNGYYDEITAAGEEVYCSCKAQPIYSPQKLPIEFLTEKGKRELKRN